MKLVEFIAKKETISLAEAIPLVQQIYVDAHNWNPDDSVATVVESKRIFALSRVLIENIKNTNIEGELVEDVAIDQFGEEMYDLDGEPVIGLCHDKSSVNLKSLVEYLVKDASVKGFMPYELLAVVGIEDTNISMSDSGVAYEDIISDETILKLKELPLPQLKQQVAMLAEEKKKWDASIMAATKIGLLFCEDGLEKPPTEKIFLAEYMKHLDKLPSLPKATLQRIYSNLPEGYKFNRNKGQDATEQVDLAPIINAAVYAGSIYDTDDVKILKKLKNELLEHEYQLPSDDVLTKIIAAVKDL